MVTPVSSRPPKAFDKTIPDRVAKPNHHNRYRASGTRGSVASRGARHHNDICIDTHALAGKMCKPVVLTFRGKKLDGDSLPVDIAQVAEPFKEWLEAY